MTFRIYRDNKGEWRWRLVARNGRILADSGEGYKTKRGCRKTLGSILNKMLTARFEIKFDN